MNKKGKRHYEKADMSVSFFRKCEILLDSEPFASDNYDDGSWFAVQGGN